MARAVATERGANRSSGPSARSAGPLTRPQEGVVDLAKAEALQGELGDEPGFETMWENVANVVMSYTLVSDLSFVSEEYGKETHRPRRNAIEVERVADDPPERVQAWVATVSDSALAQLDLEMLLDLLRIEGALAQWEPLVGDRRGGGRAPHAHGRRRRRSRVARSVGRARQRPTVEPRCGLLRRRPWIAWEQAQSPVTSGCTSARSSIPTSIDSISCVSCSGRASCGRWPTRSPEKRTPLPFAGSRRCFSVLAPPGAARSSNSRIRRTPPSGARLSRCSGAPEARKRCSSSPQCSAMTTRRFSASPSTRWWRSGRPTPIRFCTGCCSKPIRLAKAAAGVAQPPR